MATTLLEPAALLEQAKRLPVVQRVNLMNEIWESLTADGSTPSLTSAQESEIAARVADDIENPDDVVPLEHVKAELQRRFGMKL